LILHEKKAFGPTKLMIHMGNVGFHWVSLSRTLVNPRFKIHCRFDSWALAARSSFPASGRQPQGDENHQRAACFAEAIMRQVVRPNNLTIRSRGGPARCRIRASSAS